MAKLDPTERTEENTERKGRWKEKVYSKQIVEYANQIIRPDEKNLYNSLFRELVDANKIESAEDLMMLDNALFDYLRIKRLQAIIAKEGDFVTITLRSGQTIKKAHEASYLLNAIQTQFRNTMKELMLTRKEIIKKKIGMGTQDFASFLKSGAVDAEYEVKDDGMDKESKEHKTCKEKAT